MGPKDHIEAFLRTEEGYGPWKDPCHISTSCFRKGVLDKLNRDPQLRGDGSFDAGIEEVEIWTVAPIPEIENFCGIFEVDSIGIWFYDGDGHIDDPVWRQGLIPWHMVASVRLHQQS